MLGRARCVAAAAGGVAHMVPFPFTSNCRNADCSSICCPCVKRATSDSALSADGPHRRACSASCRAAVGAPADSGITDAELEPKQKERRPMARASTALLSTALPEVCLKPSSV